MEKVHNLITLIGQDNNMPALPLAKMPSQGEVDGFDFVELEAQAKRLTDDEADLLATGEHTEVSELVKAKDLRKLDSFLNEAFDGYLNKLYFVAA